MKIDKEGWIEFVESVKYFLLSPRFRIIFLDLMGLLIIGALLYFIITGKFDLYNFIN
ncbi:MAG TPA: hypothetical protein PLQ81_07580 [bacterium]|nr:hypothetical protein [bacterium]